MVKPHSYSYFMTNVTRRFKSIGIVSIAVGLMSVLICVMVFQAELAEMINIRQDQRQRGPAYSNEFQSRQAAAKIIISLSAIELGVGILAIVAAILLLRSNAYGIVLHRIYAFVQLFVNIVISVMLMSLIFDSPAGMVFFLGAIPGLILSIYPIVVLILLGGIKLTEAIPENTPPILKVIV